MDFLSILWLCVITLFDSFLLFGLIWSKIISNYRLGFGPGIAVFVVSLFIHIATAVLVGYQISIGLAIVANSLFGLVWGLFFYFLFNRFAHVSGLSANTSWMPITSFVFFLSSVISLWLCISWYWAALPLVIWLIMGFVCVEIAIWRIMRRVGESGEKLDRGFAIFSLNNNQERKTFSGGTSTRYPFP